VFETAINTISNTITSPIAKVIAYKQQMLIMIPGVGDMEADAI
jgi:hypothetical protein